MTKEDKAVGLLLRLLETIDEATTSVTKEDCDCGIVTMPDFRYMPTFELYEEDIVLIRQLQEDNEGMYDFSKILQ